MGDGDVQHQPGLIASLLIWVIRAVALLVSLVIWVVVGFLYWIPMLVFAIVRFSALVVYTALSRTDPSSLGAHLDRAVGFYVEGFSNIFAALAGRRPRHGEADPRVRWDIVLLSTLWTLMFWSAVGGVAYYYYVTVPQQRMRDEQDLKHDKQREILEKCKMRIPTLAWDAPGEDKQRVDRLEAICKEMEELAPIYIKIYNNEFDRKAARFDQLRSEFERVRAEIKSKPE
jgi:membrane protein implicated in regulation of membrane protease activity